VEPARLLSICFYILIAVVTCVMAYGISDCGALQYSGGYPTRRNVLNRILTAGIFVILFSVSALRFDVGNDYYNYAQTAYEASIGGYVVTEIGFNYLVKALLVITGGDYYELMFAVFAFATILIFLKAIKRLSVNFFDTFFVFMMLGMYFQTFNTVRYYLALSIAFYSLRYVLEKDWLKFVFVIVIAALFHKSVLIVIPVYFIATFEWKKWQLVVGALASIICFIFRDTMLELALNLYPSYRDTIFLSGGISLTSVARIFAVIVLYLWFCYYYNKKNPNFDKNEGWYRELRLYGQLNMVAFIAATLFSFLPVITRLAYYFSINQILLIPLIISKIDDEKLRTRLKFLIGIFAVIYFIIFLLCAHKEGVVLLPYKSWLFSTERYTFR
jgi:hypothetical protein